MVPVTSRCTSGVKTPEFPDHFGTAEAVPSRVLFVRSLLVEAHLDVRALFEVHGFDETHLAVIESENHGGGAYTFAEEAHAFEQIAVGDAGAGEDHFLTGCQVFGGIDAMRVLHAHAREAFVMLWLADDEAGENLTI